MERREVLENVLKWNQKALKKATMEKDASAMKRFEVNISNLETEIKGL